MKTVLRPGLTLGLAYLVSTYAFADPIFSDISIGLGVAAGFNYDTPANTSSVEGRDFQTTTHNPLSVSLAATVTSDPAGGRSSATNSAGVTWTDAYSGRFSWAQTVDFVTSGQVGSYNGATFAAGSPLAPTYYGAFTFRFIAPEDMVFKATWTNSGAFIRDGVPYDSFIRHIIQVVTNVPSYDDEFLPTLLPSNGTGSIEWFLHAGAQVDFWFNDSYGADGAWQTVNWWNSGTVDFSGTAANASVPDSTSTAWLMGSALLLLMVWHCRRLQAVHSVATSRR